MSDDRQGRVDPKTRFYIASAVFNLDGTLQIDGDATTAFPDLETALACATEGAEDNNDDFYIYECRPIRRVLRGKVRVIDLTKK